MQCFDINNLNNDQLDKLCDIIIAYRNDNFTDFALVNFHIKSAKPNYNFVHNFIYLFDKFNNKVKLKNNKLTFYIICPGCNNIIYDDKNLICCC